PKLPKVGQWVQTPKGRGQVTDLNVLLMKVTVSLEDGGFGTWHVSELSGFENQVRSCCNGCIKGVMVGEGDQNDSVFQNGINLDKCI
ncbi:MAG: hypothetical protein ACK40X_11290, partial [Armatimonadota bacterium]